MKIKLLFLLICSSMVYAPGVDGEEEDNGYDDEDDTEINDKDFAAKLRAEYLAKFRDEDDDREDEDAAQPITTKSPVSTDTSVGFSSRSTTESSIGDNLSDDSTQKSVSFNLTDPVKENASANMLHHFENNFIDFNNDADALQAVKQYLDDGGKPNAINAQGKSLITLLLDNLSSNKQQYQGQKNARIKEVLTLLVDKGATPTSAEIDKALETYRNIVTLNSKSRGFVNSFVARFLTSDAQKEQMKTDKQRASQLADIVFMLDDAAPKNVVTLEQREEISNLEAQYKSTFQRVASWWKRTSKSLFSKN